MTFDVPELTNKRKTSRYRLKPEHAQTMKQEKGRRPKEFANGQDTQMDVRHAGED